MSGAPRLPAYATTLDRDRLLVRSVLQGEISHPNCYLKRADDVCN
jgi:hypothetical protein